MLLQAQPLVKVVCGPSWGESTKLLQQDEADQRKLNQDGKALKNKVLLHLSFSQIVNTLNLYEDAVRSGLDLMFTMFICVSSMPICICLCSPRPLILVKRAGITITN